MNQNLAVHMSLQAASHQLELKKVNTQISELEIQLDKARTENRALIKRSETGYSAKVAAVSQKVKKSRTQSREIKKKPRAEVKRSLEYIKE